MSIQAQDDFYARAIREARTSSQLSAIEQVALLPIKYRWEAMDIHDTRWWSGVSRLREDGAAVITPLTVERVDAYARAYWADGTTSPWSMPPNE